MKLRALLPATALTALLFAACSGGGESATPTAETSAAASPSATADAATTTGSVQPGKALTAAGGKLEVRTEGSSPLDVTVRELQKEPAALPQGWQLVMPAVEITAAGESGPVTALKDPLSLRFRTSEALATILSYDGKRWEMVPSDLDGGYLEASVDHLSVYAVARPAFARPRPAATNTPTGSKPSATSSTTGTPRALPTTVTPTVSIDAIKSKLSTAIDRYREDSARITRIEQYAPEQAVLVPELLEDVLTSGDLAGAPYRSVYGGVNQAFWADAPQGSSGSLLVLVEPKTEFPSTASGAQELLASYFPGAAGIPYVPVTQNGNAYTFQASRGSSFIVLGLVRFEGVPVAFLSAGSDLYVGAAVRAKE